MIIKMTESNMNHYNRANEGFIVFGRINPKYENNAWTYTEEIFPEPYSKKYENEKIDISYINDESKVVFFYYNNSKCIGQIRLRGNWNGYAYIEDIAVAKDYRKCGVGTALLNTAINWAKLNNFCGLMLETQDINLSACRFYSKNNFIIGSIDTMIYSNLSSANEIGVFWYYKF